MNIYDLVGKFGWYGLLEGNDRQANGNTWFVDGNSGNAANNASVGQGASWDQPFANINYAISRCSNNAGDIILMAAGHTETIADTNDDNVSGTTTDEFCVDKAGVTIIGLGTGTRRPTITLASATDACIDVRAANCVLYNLVFYNTIADNVAMLDAQSAADGLIIENCKFYDSAANAEAILQVNLTANCDDVTIRGCKFYNVDTNSGGLAAIKLEGGSDKIRIVDNVFDGDWNEQVIDADTAASTEVEIIGNVINNIDNGVASAIDLHSGSTGVVADNIIHSAAGGSGGGAITAAGCLLSNNRVAVNEGQNTVEDTGSVGGTMVGNHWYVDSGTGAATNNGKSWSDAVSTVDVAIGLATASNGDVIHVAAGHAESLTGATVYILDMDKKGISIIGEGVGAARPTFTFTTDATNALVDLTEDDCRISNCIFACNMDDQVQMIKISGDDCEIDHCDFLEGGQVPLTCIRIGVGDGDSDNAYIHDNRFYIPTADDGNAAIDVVKDMAGIRIEDNYFRGDWDDSVVDLDAEANACTDLRIVGNVMINQLTGQHLVQISGVAVTGLIANNTFVNDDRDQCASPAICQMVNNKWSKLGTGMVGIDNVDPNNAGIHLFVDSGAASAAATAGHGYSWAEPLSTIHAAIALCTADNGDIIHVAPGHEESMTDTVGTHPDFDTAGITVIGHGSGSNRPSFVYDHADAEVVIEANNITIKNMRFVTSANAVTNGIIMAAGACDFHLIDCDFGFPETVTDEFAIAVLTGDASDRFVIDNCKFMAAAQAAVVAIDIVTDTDHSVIKNCTFTGAYSVCPIRGQSTASTYLDIYGNVFMTTGTADTFNLVAGSTGMVHDNRIVLNAGSYALAMDIGNCWSVNNFAIADDDVTGAKGGLIDNGFVSCAVTADG